MNGDEKSFDEVMDSITSGLTGDAEHDRKHLMESMEEYKDHPLGTEIARACGRLMWDLVPDDMRERLEREFGNRGAASEATLEEVSFNLKSGNPSKALQLIQPVTAKLDELCDAGWNADDSESRYFNFRSVIDEVVWRTHTDDKRVARRATEPFSRAYMLQASILFELGRHEEAITYCRKAIRWNPVDVDVRFELAENYKRLRLFDEYGRIIQELFPYVATAEDLAHYHRARAYYCIETNRFEVAAAHLTTSLMFVDSPIANSELMYLKKQFGQDYTDMTASEGLDVLEDANEFVFLDDRTYNTLQALVKLSFDNGDYQTTVQTASDLYRLTKQEEYLNIVNAIIGAAKEAGAED